MFRRHGLLSAFLLLLMAAGAAAEDVYYNVPLAELKLIDGQLPPAGETELPSRTTNWRQAQAKEPYVVLDGPGEAYLSMQNGWPRWQQNLALWRQHGRLFVRAPRGKEVQGALYLPKPDQEEMLQVKFVLPSSGSDAAQYYFFEAKADYYRHLLERRIPGGAWFRFQMKSAEGELGRAKRNDNQPAPAANARRVDGLEDTFALFSGSRAISENLQLDRPMQAAKEDVEKVPLATLTGITVKEIDWQPLLKDQHPQLDPLARLIPADQHAVFFPSFAALIAVSDEINREGAPLARIIESRSEDERLKERYERQLGLPLSLLARLLGKQVIDSVALTGSDPYFFAGTDVALVFEAKHPTTLKALLLARVAAAAQGEPGVKPVQGEICGVSYAGFVSPDRRVSSYVAATDKAVIVTNSTAQLARLAAVQAGKSPALAELPEYAFFRTRYPLGDADETALLFLSDATIRRWCGPRWRIADSRRTRAASKLAELQAERMDELAAGAVKAGPLYVEEPPAYLGKLELSAHGVRSAVIGSLDFLTPIVELNFDKVSSAEATAYQAWRDRYQTNWRWAFDPIAVRLTAQGERLAADLSVMPLIIGSDYRTLVETSRGAEIKPSAGDPHDSLLHVALAINARSQTMRQANGFVMNMAHVGVLDWLGESIAVYVDDDPLWQELAEIGDRQQAQSFLQENFARLPVALYCEVANAPKLTLFMAGLRGMLNQTAPEMSNWETLKHGDEPYVRISPTERARGRMPLADALNVYYAFWSDGLIVTLNEDVLKRALDRRVAKAAAKADGREPETAAEPWLGSNLCLRFDRRAIQLLDQMAAQDYGLELQLRSWNNLPILNEWRRRYPDRNPVELHEQLWGARLVCPAGGEYVWNDEWQTMESTAFGHPGQPKRPESLAAPWQSFKNANLGVTFEHEGLRAKAVFEREQP